MKGDKYHYNQGLGQAEPGAPPYWKAYDDRKAEEDKEPEKEKELPLCRGGRHGDVPGETCRIFVTSTSPGSHGNTML